MSKIVTLRRSLKSRRPSVKRVLRFLGVPHATRIHQVHPIYLERLVAARRAGDDELAKTLSWVWSHLKKNMYRSCPDCKEAISPHAQRCRNIHKENKPEIPTHLRRPYQPKPYKFRFVDAVRTVINGEPMTSPQIQVVIRERFPNFPFDGVKMNGTLSHLRKRKEVNTAGTRHSYKFTKAVVLLVLLIPILIGCSTARHAPEPIPAAIMPRRMPDAPRPAETVKAIPTTVSYYLSWTHEPLPELLTYRVDYWPNIPPVQGGVAYSFMTQTNNCTIQWLEPDREYTFRVVGCDGRRYSELENLHLVIK